MSEISNRPIRRCDGVNRRSFLKAGFLGLGGVTLADVLRAKAAADAPTGKSAATPGSTGDKTSVILFWLDGGPTHMETYDLKPEASDEFRGPLMPIRTAVPGIHISELLPRHARIMDKLSIIRSMHHNNGDHFAAAHWMTTGYHGSTAANMSPMYPSAGSYVSKLRGAVREGVPAYVSLPVASTVGLTPGYFSATYLGAAFNPFSGGDGRVKADLTPAVEAGRLGDRVGLLQSFDNMQREMDAARAMDEMDKFQRQAVGMMLSGAAKEAFDVTREPQKMRDFYGPHAWSQYALAGRRLVEAGVRFVTLNLNGWDDHSSLDKAMRSKLPPLDRAVACLVEDLDQRGLLDTTMVLVMGEFGRTPRINKGLPQDPVPGRDHWGEAMSVLIAGGGVKGGVVVGSTDARGERPKDRPTTPGDTLATVYHQLGIDHTQSFLNHAGRPVPVLTDGEPIRELL